MITENTRRMISITRKSYKPGELLESRVRTYWESASESHSVLPWPLQGRRPRALALAWECHPYSSGRSSWSSLQWAPLPSPVVAHHAWAPRAAGPWGSPDDALLEQPVSAAQLLLRSVAPRLLSRWTDRIAGSGYTWHHPERLASIPM